MWSKRQRGQRRKKVSCFSSSQRLQPSSLKTIPQTQLCSDVLFVVFFKQIDSKRFKNKQKTYVWSKLASIQRWSSLIRTSEQARQDHCLNREVSDSCQHIPAQYIHETPRKEVETPEESSHVFRKLIGIDLANWAGTSLWMRWPPRIPWLHF